MHADPSPNRFCSRRSACSRWIVMRVPLAASGCPIAIAPPHALVRVRSRPSSRNRNRDRKSTRLNSSHSQISYAVFCLKCYRAHRDLPSFPTRRSSDLSLTAADARRPEPEPLLLAAQRVQQVDRDAGAACRQRMPDCDCAAARVGARAVETELAQSQSRSEEHTSELQSQSNLVCRLLLEMLPRPPRPPLFPYTTLFRSLPDRRRCTPTRARTASARGAARAAGGS